MIRQRVDRHGKFFHLQPASELPGCNVSANEIGVIKEGPVKKWMAAKHDWDTKFASSKRRVQKQRLREMAEGYDAFGVGEVPPPSALAGRRKAGADLKEEKKKKSMGMSLWSLWGSKHDEKTIHIEAEADREPEIAVAKATDGTGARPLDDKLTTKGKKEKMASEKPSVKVHKPEESRSRSRRRTVTDQNQTNSIVVDENTPAAHLIALSSSSPSNSRLTPFSRLNHSDGSDDEANPILHSGEGDTPSIRLRSPTVDQSELKRPKKEGIAYPFSRKMEAASASMTTLTSVVGVRPVEDVRTGEAMGRGEGGVEGDEQVVKSNGNVVSADKETDEGEAKEVNGNGNGIDKEPRPVLETFTTAAEELPRLDNVAV